MAPMKASRVAAWMVCAAVGGAWLASAAGVTRSPRISPATARSNDDVRLDTLVADVQAQAGRLRVRLSEAPAPTGPERNPFAFAVRPRPVVRTPVETPPPIPSTAAPVFLEPALELIGVAETRTSNGVVRTAMLTGGRDELMMVTVGQQLLSRYEVVAVSVDAVELKDLETGSTRRLVLR